MWNSIFDPENLFFSALSWLVDIVGISFLWLVLSLPVITAPAAAAALYHACALYIRKGTGRTFTAFFRVFLQSLKQGCILAVPLVLAVLALFLGWGVMASAAGALGGSAAVLYGAYCAMLLVPLGMVCWLFPLLGRFQFGLKELCRTAFMLTLRHLPSTLLSAAVMVLSAWACLRLVPLFLAVPALAGTLQSVWTERVFGKYMS